MKAEIVNSNCCRQKIANFISFFALPQKIQNPKSKIQNRIISRPFLSNVANNIKLKNLTLPNQRI